MVNELSRREFIEATDVLTNSNFSDHFLRGVKELMPIVKDKIKKITGGNVEVDRELTGRVERLMQARFSMLGGELGRIRGFGYLASSLDYSQDSPDKEIMWAAFLANAFSESGVHPLVIPIDTFYLYLPLQFSLVSKTTYFSNQGMFDDSGKPYAFVLSGFTQSDFFTERSLSEIPSQEDAGLSLMEYAKKGAMLLDFACNGLRERTRPSGNLQNAFSEMKNKHDGRRNDDLELLLTTSLLLQDRQMWQSLWYEGSQGTPLYIVAPASFHDAMNRLNFGWGHGCFDYEYRAANSLGAQNTPFFDVVDGVIKTSESFEGRKPIDRGLGAEEFYRRVDDLI